MQTRFDRVCSHRLRPPLDSNVDSRGDRSLAWVILFVGNIGIAGTPTTDAPDSGSATNDQPSCVILHEE